MLRVAQHKSYIEHDATYGDIFIYLIVNIV